MILQDEKLLRRKCKDASANEVAHIVHLLDRELGVSRESGRPGIGLAAPQINLLKRIAIIRLDNYNINLVNANIKQGFDKKVFDFEGCLSFPDRTESTLRYQQVVVSNMVEPNEFIATGLLAVAIQHELDHLNGVLLPDLSISDKLKKMKPKDLCLCESGKKFKNCCGKNNG